MKLSILIVNYNGKKYLGACLRSIKDNIKIAHEVIVVDNASTDGSCEFLRQSFPDVKLIVSERNLGFAGGNNLGAAQATGELILLLNTDTVLINDINPAIELLERDQTIGVVGAMMLDGNEEYCLSAGYFPSLARLFRYSSLYIKNGYFKSGNFPQSLVDNYPVDWVAGSFMLIRLPLWNRLNGLDEGYFMYGEDVDFCRRVRDIGFVSSYCPAVRYIHYCGFEPSRLPLVTYGLKRYHKKFSGVIKNILVAVILNMCFAVRVILYFILFIITRRPKYGVTVKACIATLRT